MTQMRTDFDCTSEELFEQTVKCRSRREYENILGLPLLELIEEKRRKLGRKLRLLDVGCGIGLFPEEMSDSPHVAEAWGVDLHAHRGRRHPRFRTACIERGFPVDAFGGPFDLIVSVWAFSYVRNKLRALLNTALLLHPDGEAHVHLPSFLVRTDDMPSTDEWAMDDPEKKRIGTLLEAMGAEGTMSFRSRFPFLPHDESLEATSTFSLRRAAGNCRIPPYAGSFQPVGEDAFCYADYRIGTSTIGD